MSRRIGIYAGTFDPVHVGHVAFAKVALGTCGLDEVVFMLERDPWGKPGARDVEHRVAMAEDAVRGVSGLRVLKLDAERFTARLALPELERRFGDAELVLLMGSDVARALYTWDHVGELLAVVSLVIGLRNGDAAEDIDGVMAQLIATHGPVAYQIITVPQPEASSTAVRSGDHAPLHPDVSNYIRRHGLYDAHN